jgi:PAS domain S-box-containing protein
MIHPVTGRLSHSLRRRRSLLVVGTACLIGYAVLFVILIIARARTIQDHRGEVLALAGLFVALAAGLVLIGYSWLQVSGDKVVLDELHEAEAQLRLFQKQVPADVWTTDTELRLTSVFGVLSRDLEAPALREPGRTLYEIFGPGQTDHPTIAAHLRALRGESTTYERATGDVILEGRVEPLRDERGDIVGCVGVAVDVTWQRAEAQLHRLLAHAVEAATDLISVTDAENRFVYVNETFLRTYGLTRQEVLGQTPAILGAPQAVRNEVLAQSALGGWDGDLVNQRKDGTAIPVSLRTSVIRDAEGKVAGLLGVARDISERRRAEEELRLLARHLDSVREQEHTRMAREIHDEVGQALTALRLDLTWVGRKLPEGSRALREKIDAMVTLADETIEAGRRIVAELRPPILDDLGLGPALEWYTQHFAQRSGLRVELDVEVKEVAVDDQVAVIAYRIVQEALTNVARHAQATHVTVRLGVRDGALALEIADDGKGIRPEAAASARSFGIVGMRERAQSRGGLLEVTGSADRGTSVRVTIPFERRREPREGA